MSPEQASVVEKRAKSTSGDVEEDADIRSMLEIEEEMKQSIAQEDFAMTAAELAELEYTPSSSMSSSSRSAHSSCCSCALAPSSLSTTS